MTSIHVLFFWPVSLPNKNIYIDGVYVLCTLNFTADSGNV